MKESRKEFIVKNYYKVAGVKQSGKLDDDVYELMTRKACPDEIKLECSNECMSISSIPMIGNVRRPSLCEKCWEKAFKFNESEGNGHGSVDDWKEIRIKEIDKAIESYQQKIINLKKERSTINSV